MLQKNLLGSNGCLFLLRVGANLTRLLSAFQWKWPKSFSSMQVGPRLLERAKKYGWRRVREVGYFMAVPYDTRGIRSTRLNLFQQWIDSERSRALHHKVRPIKM